MLKITLIKSTNDSKKNQQKTVKALGLKKIGSSVVKEKNDAILGMIHTVNHLVKVEEVNA
ncbi:MAG: 50S ribosomal protein L30 [Clostridia bacterium]|nr:50S ribosomal protein L30 [Clostridia bacterium]